MSSTSFSLHVNGERVTPVHTPSPSTTLLSFLRNDLHLTGAKLSCGQGGCGACAVVVHTPGVPPFATPRSVNACLTPVLSLHGAHVTTAEGLGSARTAPHPIQARLAANNATQCGFCTPGMVMATYGLLQANPDATMADLEHALDGNLCRCTGYSSILAACQTFASDADTQPAVASLRETLSAAPAAASNVPEPPTATADAAASLAFTGRLVSGQQGAWHRPASLQELCETAQALADAGTPFRLVGGNTSLGVYPDSDTAAAVTAWIHTRGVPELVASSADDTTVALGAACTLTDLVALLAALPVFASASAHLSNIAGTHVRNAASWVGNLAMVRQHGFASDLATVLLALDARLTVVSFASGETTETSLEAWLGQAGAPASPESAVVSLAIPVPDADATFVSTYRVAMRPINAHALVNAGFRVTVNAEGVVEDARVFYGAIADRPVRVAQAEAALTGHPLDQATFQNCLPVVAALPVHPEPAYTTVQNPQGRTAYRQSLLQSFLFKFFEDARAWRAGLPCPHIPLHRTRGPTQVATEIGEGSYPGGAIPKFSAVKQTTGEAEYVGDMPHAGGDLHGAFVLSTQAAVTLEAVDASAALEMPGVARVITGADITGFNDVGLYPCEEQVLIQPQGNVPYVGAPVAFVVARSHEIAVAAAAAVEVSYGAQYETPLFTIGAAVEAGALMEDAKAEIVCGAPIDEALGTATHTLSQHLTFGGQDHFFMEKHTAYARLEDGDNYRVYIANQAPDYTRLKIAAVLGVDAKQVVVECRRTGGGFGGKVSRQVPVGAACAVATQVTGRDVHCTLPIQTQMRMCRGRGVYEADVTVGFDDDGRITCLKVVAFQDSGYSHDFAGFESHEFVASLDTCYAIPNWSATVTPVRTHLPTATACRGPGHPDASYVIEQAIEAVAAACGMTPEAVRVRNHYTAQTAINRSGQYMAGFNLPQMWAQLEESCAFEERRAAIEAFNAANKWRKRGISMQGTSYGVTQGASMGTHAMVSITAEGVVHVYHGGCEIGQGIHTKVAQVVAEELGCPLECVRVGDTRSDIVHCKFTGGSSTTEANAEAARRACIDLNQRLRRFKDLLWRASSSGDEPSWTAIVASAHAKHTKMSATGIFVPRGQEDNEFVQPYHRHAEMYHVFSVACTEAEVDVLTGEVTLRRADLLYDPGRSVNPLIDIGQVVGAYGMGLGYYLREEYLYDADGNNAACDTWEYKPPAVVDIPEVFNASLVEETAFPTNILGVKACGEPAITHACTAFSAVKMACAAARGSDADADADVCHAPFTVDRVLHHCHGADGVVNVKALVLDPDADQ